MNLFPTDQTGLDDGRVGTKVRQRDARCMMYGVIPYQRDPDVEKGSPGYRFTMSFERFCNGLSVVTGTNRCITTAT